MQTAFGGELPRVLQRFLEVRAMDHQFGALRGHGAVLFRIVAFRHHDHRAQTKPRRRRRDRLTVIAASRRDDARAIGLARLQFAQIRHPATDLERADGRMVLVLDPDLAAGAPGQQRPRILWRGRHHRVNAFRRFGEFGQVQTHLSPPFLGARTLCWRAAARQVAV